ncbi:MarR family winged helix-turn-helix transcriptional regulator [Thermomonospora umbrina]|uniref:DNA-binding MarR family transcriptional regulator n=1 Tax=Thermomonospora umbrina TaxID=111806 RepID=A0A3D9SJ70_9ACTN|nr:MarR family transcriptional regulator [Thermomonospora umbrina]REE95747.1 DNA-binding MarR family transcriptional regulator [Thermomonospora umbrina]
MALPDDAAEARAQGWRTLAALHSRIEGRIERALEDTHDLSVNEYCALNTLSQQNGWHMRMQQLANAMVLSQSATTRLVNRLEDRGLLTRYLCQDDRRGIYTEVTPAGARLLEESRPTHDGVLSEALAEAAELPELAPLVKALESLLTPA